MLYAAWYIYTHTQMFTLQQKGIKAFPKTYYTAHTPIYLAIYGLRHLAPLWRSPQRDDYNRGALTFPCPDMSQVPPLPEPLSLMYHFTLIFHIPRGLPFLFGSLSRGMWGSFEWGESMQELKELKHPRDSVTWAWKRRKEKQKRVVKGKCYKSTCKAYEGEEYAHEGEERLKK